MIGEETQDVVIPELYDIKGLTTRNLDQHHFRTEELSTALAIVHQHCGTRGALFETRSLLPILASEIPHISRSTGFFATRCFRSWTDMPFPGVKGDLDLMT
jgi:hypothetical protein